MKEYYYDKLFNINTKASGNNKGENISHYHPYEPTPYIVLEELLKHYEINKEDTIVDFGCGFGRLVFFLHYHSQATVKGIEVNKRLYDMAILNRKNYRKKIGKSIDNMHFYNGKAEEYSIKPEENRFYFFHPFSGHIFRKVINNILNSAEKKPRPLEIILYYGHEDYIDFLERSGMFVRKREINIPYLSSQNSYEKIIIYRLQ
ncbi:methyltransferase [Compostibacillus humi]|uniref:Methyltransferase n=1 Tax=Compostibacillus humi TaxID=1245525 RepID=A0A8J2XGE5_9BACI|nr:class I SAM-dependent methyltransferase [Compostibacillus humi]GFZ83412.1 methyltransferase [Compostibacillus humi]HLT56542.1 class I SAM-dependent methyltransferase [Bacillota bacterium]